MHKSIFVSRKKSSSVIFPRKVFNIDQLLEPRSGILLLVSTNATRSWVSDCTSFDPHDRFTLRLDSTSGSGLFSCRRTRLVHFLLSVGEISRCHSLTGQDGVRGYSFRAILRQSSQRLSANCCPRSGTASQIRQTHPLSRHRFVHTSSFSRSASSVTTKEYSSIPGAVHTLPKADLIVRFLESLPEFCTGLRTNKRPARSPHTTP